jgi:hypothetical protein
MLLAWRERCTIHPAIRAIIFVNCALVWWHEGRENVALTRDGRPLTATSFTVPGGMPITGAELTRPFAAGAESRDPTRQGILPRAHTVSAEVPLRRSS